MLAEKIHFAVMPVRKSRIMPLPDVSDFGPFDEKDEPKLREYLTRWIWSVTEDGTVQSYPKFLKLHEYIEYSDILDEFRAGEFGYDEYHNQVMSLANGVKSIVRDRGIQVPFDAAKEEFIEILGIHGSKMSSHDTFRKVRDKTLRGLNPYLPVPRAPRRDR